MAAQTLVVPPGTAAVPVVDDYDYDYEYYDDDGDVEYANYGEPVAVVKTVVEEEVLVPPVHHIEEPLHHNEVITVYCICELAECCNNLTNCNIKFWPVVGLDFIFF